ncbi:MAG: myo-inosose-2 dehydratase [Saprospiraceae bacterium]|nr:myo-inosose-2 dehydratase [Saprospiraceae bacterium]
MMQNEKVKLGIAPIGWTNDDLPELGGEIPFEQCVSEIALAGFSGCEVGNKYPRDTAVLKEALELRGLQICNQWFSYELTTKSLEENRRDFEALLDFLGSMGAKVIGGGEVGNSCQGQLDVPVFEGKGRLDTDADWRLFCFKLNELGKIAYDRGFKLAFHHHMGTCIQSLSETLRMLEETDPKYVHLNYDCGHFYFAGEDPAEALEKTIARVAHVHLKDIRPTVLERVKHERLSFLDAVRSGVFTVPGDPEGCIDFAAIFAILNENKYEGWLVVEAEQDPAKANPLTYAKMARTFIREQTGL